MYVILVDDEVRILEGLNRFLLRRWPDLEVKWFDNGADALEAIGQRIPDLMITDIYMPEMNGMELIEQAEKLGVKHYAILTGYDEFTLVQQALRLHTMDYLLKPVDKEQLYRVVEQAMADIEKDHQAALAAMRSSLRLICLFGVGPTDLLVPVEEDKVFAGCSRCALVLLSGPDEKAGVEALKSCAIRAMDLGGEPSCHQAYLFLMEDEPGFDKALAIVRRDMGCVVGSAFFAPALAQLHPAYVSILQENSLSLGRAMEAFQNRREAPGRAVEEVDALLLRKRDLRERIETMEALLCAGRCRRDLWTLMPLLSGWETRTAEDRQRAMHQYLMDVKEAFVPQSPEIVTAVDMLEQRYGEEMNLIDISQAVFMTPSYFSTLFHKETGLTYVDYINQVRINRACMLMLETDQSVESVALQVGFVNPHYFFRVFKRYSGTTPGNFRNLVK